MNGIDVNCLLGHWPFRKIYKNTFDHLKQVHKENDIAYGYVSSINSIFYNDPFEGDLELHDVIKDSPYKHVLTVNPVLPGFKDDIELGIKLFGINGVRVYPGYHGYKLDNVHFSELCSALKYYNLPLFLSMRLEDERLDYIVRPSTLSMEDVGNFLSKNTDLRVLLLTFRNEELLQFKDALLSNPYVYYDTSGLKNNLFAVEKSIDAFGQDRMVYGSQHPLFCLKSTLLLVEKAELAESVKEKILYENAGKFLKKE